MIKIFFVHLLNYQMLTTLQNAIILLTNTKIFPMPTIDLNKSPYRKWPLIISALPQLGNTLPNLNNVIPPSIAQAEPAFLSRKIWFPFLKKKSISKLFINSLWNFFIRSFFNRFIDQKISKHPRFVRKINHYPRTNNLTSDLIFGKF